PLTHLRKLDLHHNYLSEPMRQRVRDALEPAGGEVDLDWSDAEAYEDENGVPVPSISVGPLTILPGALWTWIRPAPPWRSGPVRARPPIASRLGRPPTGCCRSPSGSRRAGSRSARCSPAAQRPAAHRTGVVTT
ncbi:hypothetical protein ACWCQ1_51640, partial [Streptomyces sp. NPDC002144]